MKIQAVKFPARPLEGPPLRSYLEMESPQDLEKAREQDLPVAYVVRSQHLSAFRELKDLVIDRGTKHQAKGLSRLLLEKEKVPLIAGQYRDGGQLRRSLRTLLANALRQGDRNLYLIGVGEPIFEILWRQAVDPEVAYDVKMKGRTRESASKRTSYSSTGSISARELLRIIGEEEEPEYLVQRYLGESDEARLVRQLILRAARRDCRVLIIGPTGTGKEIVARAIHELSKRKKSGEIVAVNCGAFSPHLLESEFFGHVKGAFTGAWRRKIGVWQAADNGTLFLDEIGDISKEQQGKILRTLEEGKIRPVGWEGKEIPVNVRVIAATNQDLYSMVNSGQFREDLYYRLCEFQIRTPVLSDHPGDIPGLARYHWDRITEGRGAPLSNAIERELRSLRWSGNVRELKAVLTCLHSISSAGNPDVAALRTALLLSGHDTEYRRERSSRRKAGPRRIERINHLRRIEEVLGTCQVTVRAVVKEGRAQRRMISDLQERIGFGVSELEVLCRQPLLFHSETTFSAVHEFKGKLAYFQSLLRTDGRKAWEYLKEELAEEIGRVLESVAKEMRLLLASSS